MSPIGNPIVLEFPGMSPLDIGTRLILDQGCSKIFSYYDFEFLICLVTQFTPVWREDGQN